MKKNLAILTGLIGLFSYSAAQAKSDFSGYIEGELRVYPQEAALEEQDDVFGSLATELEYYVASESEDHSFRTKLFGRITSADDGNRDHGDIRELYYNYAGSGWQLEVGLNKVFWGVTEAAHLVDIVNQTDVVESIDGEAKLGQPMIALGLEQDWGNLDFYILPYFREQKFADGSERFQLPFEIDYDNTQWQSDDEEKNIDYAIRWAHYFGDLDIGVSYFTGTNRATIPVVSEIGIDPTSPIGLGPTAFSPYYEQLDQLGLELQYILGDWALKFEGTAKQLDTGDFNSAAGGFEYTFSDVNATGIDIGLLMEYLWNDREDVQIDELSEQASGVSIDDLVSLTPQEKEALRQSLVISGEFLSPFENDIFLGTRFTMNDIASTDFLAGIIRDLESNTTIATFEGSTRIGDSVRITLNLYAITDTPEDSSFYFSRNDDQIEFKVAWYF